MLKLGLGLFTCILAIGIFSTPVFGQRSPEAMQERMKKQNAELISVLDLTEEQKPIVETILNDEAEKRLKLMQERSGSGGFGDMRQKMSLLNDETAEKLDAVLSDDQMNAFQKFREENRRGGRDGGPRRPRPNQGGTS